MDREKREKVFRYLILALIAAGAAILQNAFSVSFQIGGARAFIAVPVVVAVGMFEDEGVSAFIGLFTGMLVDMVSGGQMGYNAIVLALVGLGCSLLVSHVMRSTIVTNLIFCGTAIVLYVFFYWLFFIVFKGVPEARHTLFTVFLPSAVYTFVFSPFIYSAIRLVRKKLIV